MIEMVEFEKMFPLNDGSYEKLKIAIQVKQGESYTDAFARARAIVEEKEASSGGISFLGLLTIVFIVLKLTDKVTWSWGWVLSPLWIPLVLVFCILVLYVIAKAG